MRRVITEENSRVEEKGNGRKGKESKSKYESNGQDSL